MVVLYRFKIMLWYLLVALLITSALILSSCAPTQTNTNETQQSSPNAPTPTTNARTQTDNQNVESGLLAVTGIDGNLYLVSSDMTSTPLTSDGEARTQDDTTFYHHPTWSTHGWLSFVRTTMADDQQQSEVLAVRPGENSDTIISITEQEATYVYGNWAPATCTQGVNCGAFAFLMNDGSGMSFNIAQVNSDGAESMTLSKATQHYYSWSPDGTQMLWFRNSLELTVYSVLENDTQERIAGEHGRFQAPAWSPIDDRLLFAELTEDNLNQATIRDGERTQALGPSMPGPVYFNWSPDGTHIAIGGHGYPMTELYIMNVETGTVSSYESLTEIISFFWSPDSAKLALVTPAPDEEPRIQALQESLRARPSYEQSSLQLAWQFIDVVNEDVEFGPVFTPTLDQLYILQFFDQYAQSHQVWSPDSQHIVYAGNEPNAEPSIYMVDINNLAEQPNRIMTGTQAIFSYQ